MSTGYEQRLRAVGRLVDERGLRNVCVTEVDDGVVVTGLGRLDRREDTVWQAVTLRLTQSELEDAVQKLGERRRWPF